MMTRLWIQEKNYFQIRVRSDCNDQRQIHDCNHKLVRQEQARLCVCFFYLDWRKLVKKHGQPWKPVPILDVTNLVPTNVLLAKSLHIVVPFVRQPIGRRIKSRVMDGCVTWGWIISIGSEDFMMRTTGRKHFVTVISH